MLLTTISVFLNSLDFEKILVIIFLILILRLGISCYLCWSYLHSKWRTLNQIRCTIYAIVYIWFAFIFYVEVYIYHNYWHIQIYMPFLIKSYILCYIISYNWLSYNALDNYYTSFFNVDDDDINEFDDSNIGIYTNYINNFFKKYNLYLVFDSFLKKILINAFIVITTCIVFISIIYWLDNILPAYNILSQEKNKNLILQFYAVIVFLTPFWETAFLSKAVIYLYFKYFIVRKFSNFDYYILAYCIYESRVFFYLF